MTERRKIPADFLLDWNDRTAENPFKIFSEIEIKDECKERFNFVQTSNESRDFLLKISGFIDFADFEKEFFTLYEVVPDCAFLHVQYRLAKQGSEHENMLEFSAHIMASNYDLETLKSISNKFKDRAKDAKEELFQHRAVYLVISQL